MYNALYFNNELSPDTKLYFAVKIGRSKSVEKSNCAVTYMYPDKPPVIIIQKTKYKSMRYVVADLLHEMAHLAKPNASHGEVFQSEMRRIADKGAFKNVW